MRTSNLYLVPTRDVHNVNKALYIAKILQKFAVFFLSFVCERMLKGADIKISGVGGVYLMIIKW